jgi:5,10-methenyltetrahydromethanopterin hydrogenase
MPQRMGEDEAARGAVGFAREARDEVDAASLGVAVRGLHFRPADWLGPVEELAHVVARIGEAGVWGWVDELDGVPATAREVSMLCESQAADRFTDRNRADDPGLFCGRAACSRASANPRLRR